MTDFLSKQRRQIERRLKELEPLVHEYLTLEKAKDALSDLVPKRGPGRPPGAKGRRAAAPKGAPKARRRRRGGTRREQALRLVKQSPGITVADLGRKMGIKQNYLYRVMGELHKEGAVVREGRGYKVKG